MDAVIRFCFSWIEPEDIGDIDEYAKLYTQAKYIWDHVTVSAATKALNSL